MQHYRQALDVLVMLLILVMLVTVGLAFYGLALDLYTFFIGHEVRSEGAVIQLVINVLSVFILIELFRTFTDYIEFHRIRLHVLADVTIVFILRELLIGFYSHSIKWPEMLGIGFLIAVLVAARTVAIRISPHPEQKQQG